MKCNNKSVLIVIQLLCLLQLFVSKLQAEPITRAKAQHNVVEFLKNRGKDAESITNSSRRRAAIADKAESYYVFNLGNADGFVIASGDDSVPEILGYSEEGYFDEDSIPSNMKAWLDGYEEQITYLQQHSIRSPRKRSASHSAIAPMVNSKWNQRYPYNLSCPEENGTRCVTGCVATAMAQLMYYHREKSTNQITRYIYPYFPAGTIIDWDNMLDVYNGSETDAQRKAVADLMVYCGRAVSMKYGTSESTASDHSACYALRDYFDYSQHIYTNSKGNWDDDKWGDAIYDELSKGRPLIFSGKPLGKSVGHEFICDGYSSDGYFHFNWGWGGSYDGYYLLSAAMGYNTHQYAVFGAIPNSAVMKLTITGITLTGQKQFSIAQSGSSIVLPINITVKNEKDRTCTYSQAIVLYKKGAVVKVLKEFDQTKTYLKGEQNIVEEAVNVGTDLENGVYQLICCSKETGERYWEENDDSQSHFVTLIVKDGTMSFYEGSMESAADVITFADSETKRICVAKWDTDGDGELSYEEAAAVTDPNELGWAFQNNTTSETFDELQYFTGLSVIYIQRCTKLKSAKVPSHATLVNFERCSALQSIDLPATVTNFRFTGCSSLSHVNLPEGLTEIPSQAFQLCTSLTSIELPSTLTKIDVAAFDHSGLESVTLPAHISSIGDIAFTGCLESITVDATNEYFCDVDGVLFTKDRKTLCFYPSLRDGSYIIPYGTEAIGDGAFRDSRISEVLIPNTITTIGSTAFDRSSISALEIPNSVTFIGTNGFNSCSNLETFKLPEQLQTIESFLFYQCDNLKSVTIPRSVTKLDWTAFWKCPALTSIRSYMTTPCTSTDYDLASKTFRYDLTLYVPRGSKEAYQAADYWKNFNNIVEMDDRDEQALSLKGLPKMTYGDEGYTLPATTDQGLSLTWKSSNSSIASISGNRLTIVRAGSVTISAKQEGDDNYQPYSQDYTLIIAKAPLTISTGSYCIKQGEDLPSFTAVYSGFVNGDNASVLSVRPSFKLPYGVTSNSSPGTYTITVSGVQSDRYEPTYKNGTLTITEPDGVIIKARNYSITYGDPLPWFGYTTAGENLQGTPTLYCEATSTSPVGTYDIIVTQGSVENRKCTCVNGTLTIIKAPLTVYADDKEMSEGGELPTLTLTYSGFKNYDDESCLSEKPSVSTTATSYSPQGNYDIVVYGGWAENYELNYVNGTMSVKAAPAIIVTAHSYTREYGEENPIFTYDCDGVFDGEPSIGCEATNTSPVGTYDIIITKGSIDNDNVSYVNGTLTITKAPLTITANSYTREQGEDNPSFEFTYEGFKNSEDESVLNANPYAESTATKDSPVGSYAIGVYGVWAENYEISYVPGTLTIIRRKGDLGRKGYTDVSDVVAAINHILGEQLLEDEDAENIDMNEDKVIDIIDVILLVREALAFMESTDIVANARGEAHPIDIKQYTALQFSMNVPAGTRLLNIQLTGENRNTHQLMYQESGTNSYNIVVFSMDNQRLSPVDGNLIDVTLDNDACTTLENVMLVTPTGERKLVNHFLLNAVTDIKSANRTETKGNVYDLRGNKVQSGSTVSRRRSKGVIIDNGKKIIR